VAHLSGTDCKPSKTHPSHSIIPASKKRTTNSAGLGCPRATRSSIRALATGTGVVYADFRTQRFAFVFLPVGTFQNARFSIHNFDAYPKITSSEKYQLERLRKELSPRVRFGTFQIKILNAVTFFLWISDIPHWQSNPYHPLNSTLRTLSYGGLPRLAFGPLPADPSSFPPMEAAVAIKFLEQALTFVKSE